jgi:hypothetical protein
MVTNALAVLAFFLVGAAAARLVGNTSSYLLGLGVVGSVLYVTMLMHVPPPWTLAVMVAGSILVLAIRRAPPEPHHDWSVAPIVVTLAPIAVLLFVTLITPLNDYDGRAFWVLKAKAIGHERQIDGPFFQGEVMFGPRNEYPLLMSLDAAAVMMVARDIDDRHIRWLYVFMLAALAFHARRWVGVWPAALIPWIPQFSVEPEGSALSAYSDLPLAAFAACAVFELIGGASALRFGLWIAFMVLTKNEGLALAVILLIPAVFRFRRQVVRSFVPFAIAVATLLLWRSLIPAGDASSSENFATNLQLLPQHIDRLPLALGGYLRRAADFEAWGLLWFAVAVAAIVLLWRRDWKTLAVPAYVILAASALYIAIYTATNWVMYDLINASADRLLMHLIAPALVLMRSVIPSGSEGPGRSGGTIGAPPAPPGSSLRSE